MSLSKEDADLLDKIKQRATHHSGGIYFDSPSGEKAEHLLDCYKLVLVCDALVADRERMICAFQEIQSFIKSQSAVIPFEMEVCIEAFCRKAIAPQMQTPLKNVWEEGDPVNER